jgi:hypothetical protein
MNEPGMKKTPNRRRYRKQVAVIGFTIILSSPFVLFALLEPASAWLLKRRGGERFPLFYNAAQAKARNYEDVLDTRTWYGYLDPTLGHSQVPTEFGDVDQIPGFVIYGPRDAIDCLRVAVLGGSTTDPLTKDNWVSLLHEGFRKEGIPVQLLNGGVGGYSSSQELFKLIRDVMPLDVDLVVSLNGVNDLNFVHAVRGHPLLNPYEKRVMSSVIEASRPDPLILPNLATLIKSFGEDKEQRIAGMNLGPVVDSTDVEQWELNGRMMHAIAAQGGVEYLCFLQPIMGFGEYTMAAQDQAMLDKAQKAYRDVSRQDYLAGVRAFYDPAKERAAKLPHCEDLTDLFRDVPAAYVDARHQSGAGRGALADAVFESMRARGLLKPPVAGRTRNSPAASWSRTRRSRPGPTAHPRPTNGNPPGNGSSVSAARPTENSPCSSRPPPNNPPRSNRSFAPPASSPIDA